MLCHDMQLELYNFKQSTSKSAHSSRVQTPGSRDDERFELEEAFCI